MKKSVKVLIALLSFVGLVCFMIEPIENIEEISTDMWWITTFVFKLVGLIFFGVAVAIYNKHKVDVDDDKDSYSDEIKKYHNRHKPE